MAKIMIKPFQEYFEELESNDMTAYKYSKALEILKPIYETECTNELSAFLIATSIHKSNPMATKVDQESRKGAFGIALEIARAGIADGSLAELESIEALGSTMDAIDMEVATLSSALYPEWENANPKQIKGVIKFIYDVEEMEGYTLSEFVDTESFAAFKKSAFALTDSTKDTIKSIAKAYYSPVMADFEEVCRESLTAKTEMVAMNALDVESAFGDTSYAKYLGGLKEDLENVKADTISQNEITIGSFNDRVNDFIGIAKNALAYTADMEETSPILVDVNKVTNDMIIEAEGISHKFGNVAEARQAVNSLKKFAKDMSPSLARSTQHVELEGDLSTYADLEDNIELEEILGKTKTAISGFVLDVESVTFPILKDINNAVVLGKHAMKVSRYNDVAGIRALRTDIGRQVSDMEGFLYNFNRKHFEDKATSLIGTLSSMPDMEAAVGLARAAQGDKLTQIMGAFVKDVTDVCGARLTKLRKTSHNPGKLGVSKLRVNNIKEKLTNTREAIANVARDNNSSIKKDTLKSWNSAVVKQFNDTVKVEEGIDDMIRSNMSAGAELESVQLMMDRAIAASEHVDLEGYADMESNGLGIDAIDLDPNAHDKIFFSAMTKSAGVAVLTGLGVIEKL